MAGSASDTLRGVLRGFTLLEMIVVVGILAVVTALSLPSLQPIVHQQRLIGASDALAGFLARARGEAVSRRRCVRVVVESPQTLALEELNAFDCDAPSASTPDVRFDKSKPLYLPIATLRADASSLRYTFQVAPTDKPTGEPEQVRFRPTGRLFQRPGGSLVDDDIALRITDDVDHTFVDVIAEAQGLVCALPRGVSAGTAHDLACP